MSKKNEKKAGRERAGRIADSFAGKTALWMLRTKDIDKSDAILPRPIKRSLTSSKTEREAVAIRLLHWLKKRVLRRSIRAATYQAGDKVYYQQPRQGSDPCRHRKKGLQERRAHFCGAH